MNLAILDDYVQTDFFRSLAKRLSYGSRSILRGRWLTWLASICMLLVFPLDAVASDGSGSSRRERPKSFQRPVLIELTGDIEPSKTAYLRNRLQRAKRIQADLVVVEIDSPGGWKSESLAIGEMLRDADWAYVVAYIPREAISGAALLSFGCDEIICDAHTRFGDIGVIHWDPAEFAFRLVPAKLQSVLVREARDLAESKGHPPDLAEAMIDKEILVYYRQSAGGLGVEFKRLHVNDPPPGDPWKLVDESMAKRFLTINGSTAREIGLASELASSRGEMASLLNFETRELTTYSQTWADATARVMNSFWVTVLLVIVGLLSLYLEFSSPGIGVGALVAGLCATLFFWSHFLGGTADWLEVLLFFGGIVFLCVELFVIPGWGIAGFLGLVMLLTSVVMACQDFVVPSNADQWNQFLTSILMMLCSLVGVMIGGAFITKKIGKIPLFNQMVLAPRPEPPLPTDIESTAKSTTSKPGIATHPIVSVGDWGKSESLLRPAGRASFAGRSIDVVSDGQFIEAGQPIKVIRVQGNVVVVTDVTETEKMG